MTKIMELTDKNPKTIIINMFKSSKKNMDKVGNMQRNTIEKGNFIKEHKRTKEKSQNLKKPRSEVKISLDELNSKRKTSVKLNTGKQK